jgi:hypothetical protein
MTTGAVPLEGSGKRIAEAWWFRFLVRVVLALLAAWALSFAESRYETFLRDAATYFRFQQSLWLAWVAPLVAAGLLFGFAASMPFAGIRILPSRLLLAAFALIPLAHTWWVLVRHPGSSGGWLGQAYWFDATPVQFVSGVLTGVAIASMLGSKRRTAAASERGDAGPSADPAPMPAAPRM